ncbi:MAG: HAD hydrolase-like protein [Phycisphaeraceae bacterium]|nr:HAD hydrolase-like protein [Phycisphaeraceae bacterium]
MSPSAGDGRRRPASLRLFLFDLSGTLVGDGGRVLSIYRSFIAARGLPPRDDASLRNLMGRSKREVYRDLLGPGAADREIDAAVRGFDEQLLEAFDRLPLERLPGAADAVAWLASAGVRVGWTSGFSRRIALEVIARTQLATFGLEPDLGAASDEVPRGRPDPALIRGAMARAGVEAPCDVGVAGDTPHDLEAGARAGCRVIVGVGNGTHALEALAAYPATHLLPTLETLPAVLGGLAAAVAADESRRHLAARAD